MKRTNIWDFACKHPFLFTLGITSIAASVGNIIFSVISTNEKENNQDGNETDNVQSNASV